MRWLLPALAWGAAGCGASEARDPLAGVVFHDASGDDAPGADCASSCALPDPPGADYTDPTQVDAWLAAWAHEPVGEATESLEALLFHGPAALEALERADLDEAHRVWLVRELSREVIVEMRLMAADGAERGAMTARSPLVTKQHLDFDGTGSLGHLETGGKVKRVGLGRLWSRW